MARWCAAICEAWPPSTCSAAEGTSRKPSLYAFDLLELDGTDMRREPIEVRKATPASILRKNRHGVRLKAFKGSSTPARWAWRALCPSGWGRATDQAARRIC